MSKRQYTSLLLSKGYFPKELPPAFTTEDFGKAADDILEEWRLVGIFEIKDAKKHKGKKKNGSYFYKLDSAELEIISTPKRGFERRNLSITHPVPQALICRELSDNWSAVQKWLARQQFSLDRVNISLNNERAIRNIDYQLHQAKKDFIEATSNWLVKTDISRFYPTIYTHSIPWAAYGKEKVKANITLYDGSLADRLDALLRACNRNQTIGIPIGPETSRVIAEVISSRIDQSFTYKHPKLTELSVDRLQDDWYVGLKTLEEAESVLASINLVYRDYGLEINGHKTSVERTVGANGNHWRSEIAAFLSHKSGPIRGGRLRELLSLTLQLQRGSPHEPVISYTLAVLESQRFSIEESEPLETFLLKAVMLSPISLPTICRVLINLHYTTKRVSVSRIQDRFSELTTISIINGRTFEAIWLLYTMRGLGAKYDVRPVLNHIQDNPISSIGLVLLDMKARNKIAGSLPVSKWADDCTKDVIRRDGRWLLSYEGIRHGWLPDPHNLRADPLLKPFFSRGIVFYDKKRNVLPSATIVRARYRKRENSKRAIDILLQELRGFHFSFY